MATPSPAFAAPTADALIETGLKAQRSGDLARAAQHYQQALQLEPDSFDALQLLGLVHVQRNDLVAGIRLLERATEINPREIVALNNLGGALHAVGQIREAVHVFHRALQIDPGHVAALLNLAMTLLQVGEYRFAAKCLDRARQRDARHPTLFLLQGRLLHALRQPAAAVASFREAQALGLSTFDLHRALGLALQELGDATEALAAFRAAEELRQTRQIRVYRAYAELQMCIWDNYADDAAAFNVPLEPFADPVCPYRILLFPVSGGRLREYIQEFSRRPAHISRSLEIPGGEATFDPHSPAGDAASGRVRLGYLSPDFRDHAVGYLMAGVFEHHDRSAFELFAYSCTADSGATCARIARACEHFEDVSALTEQALLARLRRDELDIMIDLAGYTAHSRPRVLAARTAPIQVNWLGYPCTMGASFIDYIIADEFVIPPRSEADFTEQVARLPHTYLPYDRTRAIGSPRGRADYELPENALVLACFGQVRKINPPVFGAWMEVMQSVPDAVLWLATGYPPVIARLRREAEARGVAAERLVFAPPVSDVADHLVRYRLVDVALDTYPYGSHSTAADALWAGCPLVALVGDSFAARVSGSVLSAAGVPELITHSLDEYRDLVLELARDSGMRRRIRARLEELRLTCPLFDTARFVRHLEQAYLEMHQRRRQGLLPAPLAILPS